jgi:SAM-dependent methyltransferase
MSYDRILRKVSRYYSSKLKVHGATAHGVDWNSADSQSLRFDQLLHICRGSAPFTINDYGCGYGALVDHLRARGISFRCYRGFDVSPEMISAAKMLHAREKDAHFVCEESNLSTADYTLASGIFNVKLQTAALEWEGYVLQTLESLNGLSDRGFAFNILTRYADAEFMRPDLYYADPLFFFDYCKRRFARRVSLIHDYPLYEFTVLVSKD